MLSLGCGCSSEIHWQNTDGWSLLSSICLRARLVFSNLVGLGFNGVFVTYDRICSVLSMDSILDVKLMMFLCK